MQKVYDKYTLKTSENAHAMHNVGQRYTLSYSSTRGNLPLTNMPQVFVHLAPTWPLATHVKPLSARFSFHRQNGARANHVT